MGLQVEGHACPAVVGEGRAAGEQDAGGLHAVNRAVVQAQLVGAGAGDQLEERAAVLLQGGRRDEGYEGAVRVLGLLGHKVEPDGALHGAEEVDGEVPGQGEVGHLLTELPGRDPWLQALGLGHTLDGASDIQGFQKINDIFVVVILERTVFLRSCSQMKVPKS